jgi:hypothetical protein
VFECRLCISDTNTNDLFGFLLGRCGDCCLLIAQNWDNAQQFTNELETDEKYDLEIREALKDECDDYTQEGNATKANFHKVLYKMYLFI